MDELRIAGSIKDCIALLLLFSIHKGLPSWTTYSCMRALSDVKLLEPSCHLKITFLFVLILSISSVPSLLISLCHPFLTFPLFFSRFFQCPIPCFLHPFIYSPHPRCLFVFFPSSSFCLRQYKSESQNHFTARRRSGGRGERGGRGGGENWYHSKLYKNVKEK